MKQAYNFMADMAGRMKVYFAILCMTYYCNSETSINGH